MPPWDRYAQTPQQPAQAPAVPQGGQDQIVRPAPGPEQPTPLQERNAANSESNEAFDRRGNLRSEFVGSDAVTNYELAVRQLAQGLRTEENPSGDQSLIVAYARMLDPGSVVREQEFDTTAQADSAMGRTVARIQRELGVDGGGRLSPEARAKVRTEMRNLALGYRTAYEQQRQDYTDFAQRNNIDPFEVVGTDAGAAFNPEFRAYDERKREERQGQAALAGQGAGGAGGAVYVSEEESANFWGRPLFDETGRAVGPGYEGAIFDANGQEAIAATGGANPEVTQQADQIEEMLGEGGLGKLLNSGATLGLADEAGGVGRVISEALGGNFNISENYQMGRDVERELIRRARDRTGGAGTAVEAVGGLASAGAKVVAAPFTLGRAAAEGAAVGALGGFGYGEGLQGSLASTTAGAAFGGVVGAGGQRIGNALSQRATARTAQQSSMGQRASGIEQAGQAEGITVNRAMIDPALENKVTGVDASRTAGPGFQRGISEIEGQVEARVGQLSDGRPRVTPEQAGDSVQTALDRVRATSREQTNRLYTRAERQAGDVQLQPTQAIQAIDSQIAELEATGPNANRGLIRYMQDLKADLGRDGGVSLQTIRNLRTNMRGQINERALTQTDASRRVGMVMDAASADVQTALAGNPGALDAYRRADATYAERQGFIQQVMTKLVGPENNRLSPGATARALDRFMREDQGRFGRLWTRLDEAERADIRGYVATNLGRNNAGDFTPAQFVNAVSGKNRSISDGSLKTVFGEEGLQSIQNLRLLSDELKRVGAAMNSRKSGTAVGNDYRNWLLELTLGGGGGMVGLASGAGTGAALTAGAGAAAGFGARAGRDILNSRMLLSDDITRWLRQAPRTNSPAAIDKHFDRLGQIARAEPALANDIEILRNAIMQAANDNLGAATGVAAEQQGQQQP